MLELLHRVRPTISKWFDDGYKYLVHPGKDDDFVEVILDQSGRIRSIIVYSQIAKKGTDHYIYRENNHTVLFFGKNLYDIDKVHIPLRSCRSLMSQIASFLPAESEVFSKIQLNWKLSPSDLYP